MQIHIEGSSLRVELSAMELSAFALSYEQLSYRDKKTRTMLKTVLEGAGRITDFNGQGGRLLIEVFPAPNRGCTVYFTKSPRKKGRYRQVFPALYEVDSADSLLAALHELAPHHKPEVYRLNGHYVLLTRHAARLDEFATPLPTGRIPLAHLREHGIRVL